MQVGSQHVIFLVLGPEYIQRLLSASYRGQFYVQESMGKDRQAWPGANGFGQEPQAKDYTSRLGEFDIIVVIANHFPPAQVEEVKARANGKTVIYDERAKGPSLKQLIDRQLKLHPTRPQPADSEA